MRNCTDKPLFSIIIPQHNRGEYLIHTLRTCINQDYPNLEIIVSDDCSTDDSVDRVKDLIKIDSRIKLFEHPKQLGMRDNFEFALNQVRPGFVIALGGDDGLVPGCISKMHEILATTNRKLLTWPMAGFTYSDETGGPNIVYIERRKDKGPHFIKSADFLEQVARTFQYQIAECPMFYMKAVVSTDLIDSVKSRTPDKNFYICPTPDGFSGIVLAGEVEDFVFVNEPLSIGGTTNKSQGKNYQRTDSESRIQANRFFEDNSKRLMHYQLASQPYSPLVTIMTADYLLTAKDLDGWPGKFTTISFDSLIRESFKLMDKSLFENDVLVRELIILQNIAKQHGLLNLFNDLLKNSWRRVVRKPPVFGFVITNLIRFDGSKYGINNIYEASLIVPFVYQIYNKFNLLSFFSPFINSFLVVMRAFSFKLEKYPCLEQKL